MSKGHRFAIVFAYGGRFADYREPFEDAARRAFEAGYILEEDLRRYTAEAP